MEIAVFIQNIQEERAEVALHIFRRLVEKEGLVSSCWVPPHPPFPPMKTQWGSFPLPTLPLPRHRSPNNPAKVNDFIIEIIGYMLKCKLDSTNGGTFSNSVRKIILMVSMVQGV